MEQARSKINYNKSLSKAIEELFCTCIVPANFLTVIHKHAPDVLTEDDIARFRKKIHSSSLIDRELNQEILEMITRYKGWFEGIIKTLDDPGMRLTHLKEHFLSIQSEHDTNLDKANPGSTDVKPTVESQPASIAAPVTPKKLATDSGNKKPGFKQSKSVESKLPNQAIANHSLQSDGLSPDTSITKKQKKPKPNNVSQISNGEATNLMTGKQAVKGGVNNPWTEPGAQAAPSVDKKVKVGGQPTKKKADQTPMVRQSSVPAGASGLNSQSISVNDLTCCSICEAKFTSPGNAEEHYAGQKHKKKFESLEKKNTVDPGPQRVPVDVVIPPAPAEPVNKPSFYVDENGKGYCNLCNAKFVSLQIAHDHLQGKKHQANLAAFNAKK
ncbi:hypothetical protein Btru_075264 [Bulinus truncatus]|nr:hypothetical protein Btru_075264 [Bulinus truncatus]